MAEKQQISILRVPVTKAEHRQLKSQAAQDGRTLGVYLRGLFGLPHVIAPDIGVSNGNRETGNGSNAGKLPSISGNNAEKLPTPWSLDEPPTPKPAVTSIPPALSVPGQSWWERIEYMGQYLQKDLVRWDRAGLVGGKHDPETGHPLNAEGKKVLKTVTGWKLVEDIRSIEELDYKPLEDWRRSRLREVSEAEAKRIEEEKAREFRTRKKTN